MGLTQAQFAPVLGVPRSVISEVEKGHRSLPVRRYKRANQDDEYFNLRPAAEEFARLLELTPDELREEGEGWREYRAGPRGPYRPVS
jgi:transcriptional regulator with XRE-family HTH domain